jgi:hypothetical protein
VPLYLNTAAKDFKTPSMAPTTYGTWTAFYERNRDDGGAIQRLFRTNLTQFSVMSENHLDNVGRIMETVAGSNYGNMILVPGPTGFMQVLHHGFTHSAELGGPMDIIAVQGNLSEAALRVIPKNPIVMKAGNTAGRRSSVECPTLESMLGTTTADEFRNLEPARNGILKKKPNHIFIGPETFFLAQGAKMMRAGDLATLIIDKFSVDADDDDQVAEAKLDEAGTAELLLAFLWASERDLLVPVALEEPGESDVLNSIHRNMKARLATLPAVEDERGFPDDEEDHPGAGRGRRHGPGFMDDDDDDDESDAEKTPLDGDEESGTTSSRRRRGGTTKSNFREAFSLTTAGIVDVMKQVELARQNERTKDAQEKSLLRHLGKSQRDLFLLLSTPVLGIEQEVTDFMAQLAKETTATKALQQVVNESKDWEGTFTHGGFHKFLSSGFVSLDQNRANPGGFNLFMFHPRTVEMQGTFDAAKARLRDLFGAKVDDETIAHYSKQGLFAASNHHDMRVQLQTALDMLSLLVGPGSVSTKGLAYVLEPKRWSRMTPVYFEQFQADPLFGAKFLYCLDRSLQQFFRRLELPNERDTLESDDLRRTAEDLLRKLESGFEVAVRLPKALQPPPPVISPASAARATAPLAITDGSASSGATPTRKKRKVAGTPGPVGEVGSQIVTNASPCSAWQLPEGKRYADFFQGRTQSTQNWPVVPDDRLGNRSPAPLCIRFQATSACRRNCRLAHVSRASLEPAARRIVDDKFVAAYSATDATSTALVTT